MPAWSAPPWGTVHSLSVPVSQLCRMIGVQDRGAFEGLAGQGTVDVEGESGVGRHVLDRHSDGPLLALSPDQALDGVREAVILQRAGAGLRDR